MYTSSESTESNRRELSKMSVVSAELSGGRLLEPLKMTSAISLPRKLLTLCSPSTHFMASTTFDLPDPLGPTTQVMPAANSKRVRSAKLLKPTSSSALSMTTGSSEERMAVQVTS